MKSTACMMDTFGGLELRELQLSLPFIRARRDALLGRCGLRAEDADYAVGIYDADDRLVATASLAGDIIKCIATDESVRGESLAPTLVSAIMAHAAESGIRNLRVFTKPEYEPVFRSFSFQTVGSTERCVLMEQSGQPLQAYKDYLRSLPGKGRRGCVVANANPMTKGHLHLISHAASLTDTLYVIPVADTTAGGFSYEERVRILREATSGIAGVQVIEGSPYAVSRSTFPSYFIKEVSEVTEAHVALDLDIFTRHIAPALGVTVRFVGSEPTDPLTAAYNRGMHRLLPQAGIEVVEIPRIGIAESESADCIEPISASAVRRLIEEGRGAEAFKLVPHATIPALLGRLASNALQAELDLTPKPGLVDRANSGAHTDMDHRLMSRSISAVAPFFTELARLAITAEGASLPDAAASQRLGIEWERRMMEATGGVNTHRGALFSLGLTVMAVAHLISNEERLSPESISRTVKELAAAYPRPKGTHGAAVRERYGIPGALDAAQAGYPEAFDAASESNPYRRLLKLMASLEDSNIYHRGGAETAAEVKRIARDMLHYPDQLLPAKLAELDPVFISRRISPGGAADMLALTFLLRSVIHAPDLEEEGEKAKEGEKLKQMAD